MTFENKIIIFDDFIDKEYQEKIKSELLGSETNSFKLSSKDVCSGQCCLSLLSG